MGYVYISTSRVVINAGSSNKKFLRSHGRRGIFLANLSLLLADKLGFRVETDPYGRTTVYIKGEYERALEEVLNLDTLDRSGKGIIMWLLAVWDALKKYKLDEFITLEELLRLY